MKINILITGHKGFLGSSLYKELKKKKIFNLIGLDTDIYTNNRKKSENFQKIKKEFLNKIDVIIHLAGVSTNYDPKGSIYKKISHKVNYLDTVGFAKEAKKAGVKKFIFASSTSVYGNKKNKLVNEQSKLSPTTSYGKAKANSEKELVKISSKDFKVIILRMVTLFGVSKRMRFDLLVNDLIASYFKNKKIVLSSDGKKIRPQVHIKDVSKVYDYFILNSIVKNNIVLNIGRDDYNLTVGQIARKISKKLNCQVEYGQDDKDKRSYKVSFKKLQKLKILKNSKNTIEQTVSDFKKIYYKKKISYFEGKKFNNLEFMKYLIKNNTVKDIL